MDGVQYHAVRCTYAAVAVEKENSPLAAKKPDGSRGRIEGGVQWAPNTQARVSLLYYLLVCVERYLHGQ
jgi:hypothetical protein